MMTAGLLCFALSVVFCAIGCKEEAASTREKELEVELAKARASQAQAEAEKAKLEAARSGDKNEPQGRPMTADETAEAVKNYKGPGLAEVAKAQPLINPPACEKLTAAMRKYAQCNRDYPDKATRDLNLRNFARDMNNPPGGDKTAYCEGYLDLLKRHPDTFCQ